MQFMVKATTAAASGTKTLEVGCKCADDSSRQSIPQKLSKHAENPAWAWLCKTRSLSGYYQVCPEIGWTLQDSVRTNDKLQQVHLLQNNETSGCMPSVTLRTGCFKPCKGPDRLPWVAVKEPVNEGKQTRGCRTRKQAAAI